MGESVFWDKVIHNLLNLSTALLSNTKENEIQPWGKAPLCKYPTLSGENKMESSRRGDLSEIKAVAWLWKEGYEVFRNMGCTGKVDLVATKDGIIKLIDVKTLSRSKGGICFRAKDHEKQRARGIVFLYVDKESEQVGWNRDYFSE